jgi:hypothetical protein
MQAHLGDPRERGSAPPPARPSPRHSAGCAHRQHHALAAVAQQQLDRRLHARARHAVELADLHVHKWPAGGDAGES